MSNVLDGLRGVIRPDVPARTESISRTLTALLRDDEVRLADVSDYLAEHAPDLLIRLGQVLAS